MSTNDFNFLYSVIQAKQIITDDRCPQAPGQENTERAMCKVSLLLRHFPEDKGWHILPPASCGL